MKIRYIKCKSALSNSKLPGLHYSLNPYVGCQNNCAYCYAPFVLKINREKWGDNLGVKLNIPNVLSKELKKKENGTIGISTVTDPYQYIEKKYKLTRFCLEQIKNYDFPIHIQTKSSIVNRDIDLISEISNVELMVSIATLNDEERRILEPHSSSIKERIEILSNFSQIGVKTSVFLGPIYPTIRKDDLIKTLDVFIDYNVREIMLDGLNLKKGVWRNIESNLNSHSVLKKRLSKEKFVDKYLISEIYDIIKNHTKNNNIIISKAFND
jgi:DNA repair photolyase